MMRRVLILLALCGCGLPVEGGGPAPTKKAAGRIVAMPNDDLGISMAQFDPKDIQIISARYTRYTAPVHDLKERVAKLVAANGFAFFEVSDRLCEDALSTGTASQSLEAAIGSTSGAGAPIPPTPLVPCSVAAALAGDQGTLTVDYLYRGQPRRKRADYGRLLMLP